MLSYTILGTTTLSYTQAMWSVAFCLCFSHITETQSIILNFKSFFFCFSSCIWLWALPKHRWPTYNNVPEHILCKHWRTTEASATVLLTCCFQSRYLTHYCREMCDMQQRYLWKVWVTDDIKSVWCSLIPLRFKFISLCWTTQLLRE